MSAPLLVALDGSPASRHAVDLLAGYGGVAGRIRALLLHVQRDGLARGRTEARARRVAADALFHEAVERLAAAGIAAGHQLRKGPVAPAILREARRQEAAAIVMGTRGTGLVQGFALGSVAMRVVHRSKVPVILVKPEDRLPVALGQRLRVVLAMDGSAPAMRAAERLIAWRDWLGELEVHLLWVQEPITLAETILPPNDDVVEQWGSQEGDVATAAARAELSRESITHHFHAVVGDPAQQIAALAREVDADLVALGTRGLGAAHHALIGSVAMKTVVLGAVPTLLVH